MTNNVSGIGSSSQPELKAETDKGAAAALIKRMKDNSGQITRSDFKKLAGHIEGGKEKLAELLKDIAPDTDLAKLKDISFSTLFKKDSTISISVDAGKKAELINKLDGLLSKLENVQDNTSILIKGLNGSLESLTKGGRTPKAGDSTEYEGAITLSGQVGFGSGFIGDLNDGVGLAMGLTNTEGIGIEASAGVTAKINSSTEVLADGKIELSFKVLIDTDLKGKVSLAKVAQHEGEQEKSIGIGAQKTVKYTFNSIDDAKAFLANKGSGFVQEGSSVSGKTFTKTDSGFEKITHSGHTLTKNVSTTKTTKSEGWFSSIRSKFARSTQIFSFSKTESASGGTTKSFTLDTSRKVLFASKSTTSTSLTINSKGGNFEGLFTQDINIEKLKHNADKGALIDKLASRFIETAGKAQKEYGSDVIIDVEAVKKCIEGTIDKIIDKSEHYFNPAVGLPDESKGSLAKVSEHIVDQFKAEISVPVTPVTSVTAEAKASWGEMVSLYIPLEFDASTKKLAPKTETVNVNGKDIQKVSDSFVQIKGVKSGGIGAGAEFKIPLGGIVSAKAAAKAGIEGGRTKRRGFSGISADSIKTTMDVIKHGMSGFKTEAASATGKIANLTGQLAKKGIKESEINVIKTELESLKTSLSSVKNQCTMFTEGAQNIHNRATAENRNQSVKTDILNVKKEGDNLLVSIDNILSKIEDQLKTADYLLL